jgi:hypothetical protein
MMASVAPLGTVSAAAADNEVICWYPKQTVVDFSPMSQPQKFGLVKTPAKT